MTLSEYFDCDETLDRRSLYNNLVSGIYIYIYIYIYSTIVVFDYRQV